MTAVTVKLWVSEGVLSTCPAFSVLTLPKSQPCYIILNTPKALPQMCLFEAVLRNLSVLGTLCASEEVSTNCTTHKSSSNQQQLPALPWAAWWPAVPGRARGDEPLLPDCGAGKGENTPCAAASCPVVPPVFLFLCRPFLLRWESSGKRKKTFTTPSKKKKRKEKTNAPKALTF